MATAIGTHLKDKKLTDMKNLYTILLLPSLLLLGLSLQAQPYSCVRNISTNPYNPHNTEWAQMYPNDPGSFINNSSLGGFNWYWIGGPPLIDIDNLNQTWTLPPDFPNRVNMNWPFDISNGLDYLFDVPGNEYDRDYHWEDGWEVLWMNLGKLPDGTPIQDVNASSNRWVNSATNPNPGEAPYFVLYNRYTGLMRVFFNVWIFDQHYDDVTLTLRFSSSADPNAQDLSGALRLVGGKDRFLDQKTDAVVLKTPRFKRKGFTSWYVAEFQMAYDPCQCKIPSKFELVWGTTDELAVDLQSREITITKDLDKLEYGEKNFFQIGDAQAGTVIYKSIDKLVEDYKKAMDNYNEELADYNRTENDLRKELAEIAKDGLTFGTLALSIKNPALLKFIKAKQLPLVGEKGTAYINKELGNQITKSAKKILADEFDFINAALDVQEKPVKPQTPTGMFSEGRIKGTITNTEDVRTDGGILVPGTMPTAYGNVRDIRHNNFPAYNNVMGMFAVFEQPSFSYYKKNNELQIEDRFASIEGNGNLKVGEKWTMPYEFMFKTENSIKYAINEALDWDLENTSLLVSFQIELKRPSVGVLYQWMDIELDENSNFELTHRFEKTLPRNSSVGQEFKDIHSIYTSDYYHIEDIDNVLFNFNLKSSYDVSLAGIVNGFPLIELLEKQEIISIKMKIVADMYFNQVGFQRSWQNKGQQVNNFQVRTFEIFNIENQTTLQNQLSGQILAEADVNDFYTPGKVAIEQSSDLITKANKTVSLKSYIKAEEVEVNGEAIPGSLLGFPYSSYIQASKEIRMTPGARIGPRSKYIINKAFFEQPKNTPATSIEVQSFCEGVDAKYAANEPTIRAKRSLDIAAQKKKENKRKAKVLDFSIYPNPSKDWIGIELKSLQANSNAVNMILKDLTGRTILIDTQVKSNNGRYVLNLPKLSEGVYILEVETGGHKATERVLVQQD
jgi:hypothetical protein